MFHLPRTKTSYMLPGMSFQDFEGAGPGVLMRPEQFDLALRLRQDGRLQDEIDRLLMRLANLEIECRNPAELPGRRYRLMAEMWKACGGNASLLTPWFFPKYPRGDPFSMMSRPFNMILMYLLPYHLFTLRGSRQIGKAQPEDAEIQTPDGTRRMGELEERDVIFDGSGRPCYVTRIFEQGPRDVFAVQFTDGSRTRCDLEHNWKVRRRDRWLVLPLREILDRGAGNYEIPTVDGGTTRFRKVRRLDQRKNCRCISVSSPDRTYLTDDNIVTHNTTTLGVFLRLNAHMFPSLSQLYIAPHIKPLETFSRKFLEIENAFRHPVRSSKFKQNMYYKTYPSKSSIDMARVQTSATPVRGKTADLVAADEVQLFDPGLEVETMEVMNDSPYNCALYTGTSTTTESLLEVRFQEGVQATWQVQKDDGSLIDCGDPEAVMPYIGEFGFQDPKDGRPIDPSRGFYIYKNPAAFEKRHISVHVPQIINPSIYNSPLDWSKLHYTMVSNQQKFIQEKLGIPVADAHQEISENDLKRVCVNPDGPEARKKKCRDRYYRLIVSGFDWGGSDYNELLKTKASATCHVILGVAPDNKIDILHIRRHAGKAYTQIMNEIMMAHSSYRASCLASDFGGGTHYHQLLRTHPLINPSRHVIFDYDSPESPLCRTPKTSSLTNMLLLNRTESITALYLGFLMADPLFRAPSWLEMEEYLRDFLNMTRVIQESERTKGRKRFLYHRIGTRMDDVVHAMNFAYSLIRLSYDQMLVQDPAAAMMIRNAAFGQEGGQVNLGGYASILRQYAARGNRNLD